MDKEIQHGKNEISNYWTRIIGQRYLLESTFQ